MKIEKFNINIEREALRCTKSGKKVLAAYPKAFGKKEKNNFIKAESDEAVLILKTPTSTSIADVYNKFEEITNVVLCELHERGELIWATSNFDGRDLNLKIRLKIEDEFYNEMRLKNSNLSETFEKAFEGMKKEFNQNSSVLNKVYGNLELNLNNGFIEISNIKTNYLAKCGITEAEIMLLVAFAFKCLDGGFSGNLKQDLIEVNKKYSLKLTSGIESAYDVLSTSRIEDEAGLNDIEKIQFARDYMDEGWNARYCLQKYEKLVSESVVIIKDAISQGIDYKVLNESKSLVEFDLNGHKEFVIEGNKTDKDSYIFPIITDDKFTSKQIMDNNGLNVPQAILLEKDMDEEDIEELASDFYDKTLVVKPRNTNYGTGITVFSKPATKEQVLNAIKYAFEFDTNVLIEEYVKGMEYRFLVINGKCLSVAHRRIASVVGDGVSTIRQLIEAKNLEPWHFLTGTPVKMDQPVVEYLKLQGLDFDSVLEADRRVFLRTNSNCSTGGESIDMTPMMPEKFKRIAEKAAKSFDAKICGVDIIIDDVEKDDYSIIEINDNPGYSINQWPYEGKGQKIGLSILKLLKLTQDSKVKNKN